MWRYEKKIWERHQSKKKVIKCKWDECNWQFGSCFLPSDLVLGLPKSREMYYCTQIKENEKCSVQQKMALPFVIWALKGNLDVYRNYREDSALAKCNRKALCLIIFIANLWQFNSLTKAGKSFWRRMSVIFATRHNVFFLCVCPSHVHKVNWMGTNLFFLD